MFEDITGAAFSFLMNFLYAIVGILLLIAVTYPIWIKRLFPIPVILLKNAGGAKDANTVVLDGKIVRRARIINTEYGQRVKIYGIANTQPLSLLSREKAIPWEAGGVAFMVYEKEIGQMAPINPAVQNIELLADGAKKDTDTINKLYKALVEEYPHLAPRIKLRLPSKVWAPITFLNESVHIRPFPVDLVTPTMYDMKIRQERVINRPSWEKWAPYAVIMLCIVAIVVVAILSYDQVNKSIDDRLGQMSAAEKNLADQIANRMKAEGAPGSIVIPALPFLFRRRKKS